MVALAWRLASDESARIRFVQLQRTRGVEDVDGSCPATSGRGLAHAFGSLEGDGRQVGEEVVEGVVHDPAPIVHTENLTVGPQPI